MRAIEQNNIEAIAEIAGYAHSEVKNIILQDQFALERSTPSTLQFLIDNKLISSDNFGSSKSAEAHSFAASDANESFTLKDTNAMVRIHDLPMLKFFIDKELNIDDAIRKYTGLESLIKQNKVGEVKLFFDLIIPKGNSEKTMLA